MRTRNNFLRQTSPREHPAHDSAALTMSHHGQASRRSRPSARTSSRLKSVAPRCSFRCVLRLPNCHGCSLGDSAKHSGGCCGRQSGENALYGCKAATITFRQSNPRTSRFVSFDRPRLRPWQVPERNSANTTAAIKANSRLTPSSMRSLAPEPFQIEESSAKRPLDLPGLVRGARWFVKRVRTSGTPTLRLSLLVRYSGWQAAGMMTWRVCQVS